jgi:hypothetical protein
MRKADSRVRALAVLMLSAAIGGCAVYAEPGYYGEAVAVAPPALVVESYGTPPYPGYVWIGGYWNWSGGRHVWVRGHWDAPRAGYRWEPHHWVHRGDGWHLSQGHWVHRR